MAKKPKTARPLIYTVGKGAQKLRFHVRRLEEVDRRLDPETCKRLNELERTQLPPPFHYVIR